MIWHAHMIGPGRDLGSAPILRKEFDLDKGHGAVHSAVLVLSALGVVEATINGTPVSGAVLTPGWSAYEWRLRFSRDDVTALLDQRSVLGLSLGNGWYRGRLAWGGRRALYGADLGGFADLTITFEDGHIQRVVTDSTWKCAPGEVLENDLYDGQTIDARLKDERWRTPGFNDSKWFDVRELDFDSQVLTPYIGPTVSRQDSIPVVEVLEAASGRVLLDFGQNLVGWVRMQVQGPAGTQITVRHAEVLDSGELATRPLRSAKATDRYILSGKLDLFEPTFTFHGFRYVEIEGWPGQFDPAAVTATVVGSDLERTGTFRCSNPLVNRLHENVVWGMRGNFLDVPTDCPQRDERLGWTGDIAAFAPTAAFLYDVSDFLKDWLRDLDVEQSHADGIIPFVVPNVLKLLPEPPEHPSSATTALWSDAGVWVPWALWNAYGERDILELQFDSMAAHVRRVHSLLSPNGLWDTGFQFGDWLDPDAPADQPAHAKADKGVVATACAFRSADLVAQAAEVLGRAEEEREFREIADRLRTAFNSHYVEDGRIYSDCATVYALAIVFDLLAPDEERLAGKRLAELVQLAEYRISTGFAGTPFVLDALTKSGELNLAYRLLLEQECPSWLYPVTMGATTIWERWDSMLPDGTVNPGEMTSFNHYALGAVADWLHRVVGGLAAAEPGYSRLLVAPRPGGGITSSETTLRTPYGKAAVSWVLTGDVLDVHVDVPSETVAVIDLPGQVDFTVGGGTHRYSIDLSVDQAQEPEAARA